jgi:hypothetical protein
MDVALHYGSVPVITDASETQFTISKTIITVTYPKQRFLSRLLAIEDC